MHAHRRKVVVRGFKSELLHVEGNSVHPLSLIIQLNGCSSRHYGQLSIINNNMVAVAMGMKTADRTGYVCERERRGGYCALREKLITIHVDHKRAKIRLLMICCCLIKMGESYIIDDAVKRQASRTAIAKLKSRSAR